jgi:hypothetical protein
MVVNEGVLDVFLNFLCSLHSTPSLQHVTESIVVVVGQVALVTVLQGLGVKVFFIVYCSFACFLWLLFVCQAFFSENMGPIPAQAAGSYGDVTFAMLMWLKATAVYIAYHSGYNVLFQDVDLVWMEDPLPLLESFAQYDIVFMDDGAR